MIVKQICSIASVFGYSPPSFKKFGFTKFKLIKVTPSWMRYGDFHSEEREVMSQNFKEFVF